MQVIRRNLLHIGLSGRDQVPDFVKPMDRHGRFRRNRRSTAGKLESHEVLAVGRHIVGGVGSAHLDLGLPKVLGRPGVEEPFSVVYGTEISIPRFA